MIRKYTTDLINWLNAPNRKPLIIWGARQVGKTYLIKHLFAEQFFKDNYIYVDCANDQAFSEFVLKNNNVSDIISYLSLKHNKTIDEHVLLIFDEAQECPSLITSLKYFCQDYPHIPVILTGSIVRIKLKRTKQGKKYLFPIGKINELTIYPLNFEEYILNRNKIAYEAIIKSFDEFNIIN